MKLGREYLEAVEEQRALYYEKWAAKLSEQNSRILEHMSREGTE